jgi:predicted phage terminase large subunit-like protein
MPKTLALKNQIEAELAKRHFEDMCRLERPRWDWEAPHIRLLMDVVQRPGWHIIEFPVRHGKSETATIRAAAWDAINGHNVLIACHTQELAETFSLRAQNIARNFGYLSKGKHAVKEWHTTTGGTVTAAGARGAVIGRGFTRIRIDDPLKSREEAESETIRNKVYEWFTQDVWTRQEPGCQGTITMSRWNEADLSGELQSGDLAELFTVLHAPAIATMDDDPLGRAIGEVMWPERWPLEILEQRKLVMGEYAFQAQYQQSPVGKEGAIFSPVEMLEVSETPEGLPTVRAWDFAATRDAGDYTEGWRMCGPDSAGVYYIEHGVSGRWDAAEVDRMFVETALLDGKDVVVRIPQDPGQAGKDQARRRAGLLDGWPVVWRTISSSKEARVTRSQGFASAVNGGRVRIVRSPRAQRVKSQLQAFPRGQHDDIVDALTDAYDHLSTTAATPTRPKSRAKKWIA